jgi:hypothetical protein
MNNCCCLLYTTMLLYAMLYSLYSHPRLVSVNPLRHAHSTLLLAVLRHTFPRACRSLRRT